MRPLLGGIVDDWIGAVAELARRRGVPAEAATAEARLALAVARGLMRDMG